MAAPSSGLRIADRPDRARGASAVDLHDECRSMGTSRSGPSAQARPADSVPVAQTLPSVATVTAAKPVEQSGSSTTCAQAKLPALVELHDESRCSCRRGRCECRCPCRGRSRRCRRRSRRRRPLPRRRRRSPLPEPLRAERRARESAAPDLGSAGGDARRCRCRWKDASLVMRMSCAALGIEIDRVLVPAGRDHASRGS